MPKLYLLGGENIYLRTAQSINELAFHDAGKPLSVAVLPWARASFDRAYKKRKALTDYFINIGADNIVFVDFSDSPETIAQKIAASNVVYLTGGLVTALVERLKKAGVDALLKNYRGVIVGRSAGALALCRHCIVTLRHSKKVLVISGLGLTDFTLKAHYHADQDGVLMSLSKKERIYAVAPRSVIILNSGSLTFLGKVYLFENGTRKQLT
jgi:peptidase E